jgi:hypothetical protein
MGEGAGGGGLLSMLLRQASQQVCDIYESSYRVMGDNLGGGKQIAAD